MSPLQNILIGVVLGLLIPTRLIHEWSVLMRQSAVRWIRARARAIARWGRRRRIALLLATFAVGALLICSFFIISGIALKESLRNSDCINSYLSGSAPLAAARDKATQQLWDDIKAFQTLDQKDPDAAKAAGAKFFGDLDAEVAANKALQDYRDAHAPKGSCS